MEEPKKIALSMLSSVKPSEKSSAHEFVKEFMKHDVLVQIFIHRKDSPEYFCQRRSALKQLAKQLGVEPNGKYMCKLCEKLNIIVRCKLKNYVKQCKKQRWPMEYALVLAPQWLREVEAKINILPEVIEKVNSAEDTKGTRGWRLNKYLKNAVKAVNLNGQILDESVVGDLDVPLKIRRGILSRHWTMQSESNLHALEVIASGKRDAVKVTINWAIADFFLLHKPDIQLVDATSLTSPELIQKLKNLFNVVVKKRIETFIREKRHVELKKAWLEAYSEALNSSEKCSLIFMQRRWYDLKQLARLQSINNWNPHPLLKKIRSRFKHIVTLKHFPTWSEFVQNGLVVKLSDYSAQDFDTNVRNEEVNSTISQISKIDPTKAKVTLILDSDFDDDDGLDGMKLNNTKTYAQKNPESNATKSLETKKNTSNDTVNVKTNAIEQKVVKTNDNQTTNVQSKNPTQKVDKPNTTGTYKSINCENVLNKNDSNDKTEIILSNNTEFNTVKIKDAEYTNMQIDTQMHVIGKDSERVKKAIKLRGNKIKKTIDIIYHDKESNSNRLSSLKEYNREIIQNYLLEMVKRKNTDKRHKSEKNVSANDSDNVKEVIESRSTELNMNERHITSPYDMVLDSNIQNGADTNFSQDKATHGQSDTIAQNHETEVVTKQQQINTQNDGKEAVPKKQGTNTQNDKKKAVTKQQDINTQNDGYPTLLAEINETENSNQTEKENSDIDKNAQQDITMKNSFEQEMEQNIQYAELNASVGNMVEVTKELIVSHNENSHSNANNYVNIDNKYNITDKKFLRTATLPLVRCEHTAVWKSYCKNKSIDLKISPDTNTSIAITSAQSKPDCNSKVQILSDVIINRVATPKLNVKSHRFRDLGNRVLATLKCLKIIRSKFASTPRISKQQLEVAERAKDVVKRKGLPEDFFDNERNLQLFSLCREFTVNLVRLAFDPESIAVRSTKKVNLPDIDEVRQINKNILTAQVAPVPLPKDDLSVPSMKCNEDENSLSLKPEAPEKVMHQAKAPGLKIKLKPQKAFPKDDSKHADKYDRLIMLKKKLMKAKSRSRAEARKRKRDEALATAPSTPVLNTYEEWLNHKNPALKYFKLPNYKPANNGRKSDTEGHIDEKTAETTSALRSIWIERKRKAESLGDEQTKRVAPLPTIDPTETKDPLAEPITNVGPMLPTQAIFSDQPINTGLVPGAGSWIIPGLQIIPDVQGQINMPTEATQTEAASSENVIVVPGIKNIPLCIQNSVPEASLNPDVQNTDLEAQNIASGTQIVAPLITNAVSDDQNTLNSIQYAIPDIQNTVSEIPNAVSMVDTTNLNYELGSCTLNYPGGPVQSSDLQNTQPTLATGYGGQIPGLPSFQLALPGSNFVLVPQSVSTQPQLMNPVDSTEELVSAPQCTPYNDMTTPQGQMTSSDNNSLKHVATINTDGGRYLYFLPPSNIATQPSATPQIQTAGPPVALQYVPSTAYISVLASKAFPTLRTNPRTNFTYKILRVYDSQLKYVLDGSNIPMVTPCDLLSGQKPTYWLMNRKTRILFPAEVGAKTYNPEILHIEKLPTTSDPFANWLQQVMHNSDVGQSTENIPLYACSEPRYIKSTDQNSAEAPRIRVKSFAKEVSQEWPERVYIPHRVYQKIRDEPLTYVQVLTVLPDIENAYRLLSAKLPVYFWRKSGELLAITSLVNHKKRSPLNVNFMYSKPEAIRIKRNKTGAKRYMNKKKYPKGKLIESSNESDVKNSDLATKSKTAKNTATQLDRRNNCNKTEIQNSSRVIDLDSEENYDVEPTIGTKIERNINSTIAKHKHDGTNVDYVENVYTKPPPNIEIDFHVADKIDQTEKCSRAELNMPQPSKTNSVIKAQTDQKFVNQSKQIIKIKRRDITKTKIILVNNLINDKRLLKIKRVIEKLHSN